jgi:carboxymethylenebutenolidase
MKKITSLLLFSFVTALLLSYTFKKKELSLTSPDGYISCYAIETKDMIQADAGKPGFAALHIAPKPFALENQKGKMISFKSNDGLDAKGYFLKSRKQSNKWLIVIQEWWGLNDNIKKEAEKYYSELNNINVLAVDMYDGKIASTPDSAMSLMKNAKSERWKILSKLQLHTQAAMQKSIPLDGVLVADGVYKLLF